MVIRRVYLYAFDELHNLEGCQFLSDNAVTIRNLRAAAQWMIGENPSIRKVYAVDNRPGLYSEYREAVKTKDFVKHLEFEDEVCYEGMLIATR